MRTLYQEIIAYEGDYSDLFERLRLLEIFGDIIGAFDPPTAKAVIRYIAYVYSKDSEYTLARETLVRHKTRCAEAAKLPKDRYVNVVMLEPSRPDDRIPDIIRATAIKYLTYQNERANMDLKSLYDLYQEMIVASAQGATTYDQYKGKYECRKYANEIREWIKEAEDTMRKESNDIKALRSELKEKNTRHSQTIRPENAI